MYTNHALRTYVVDVRVPPHDTNNPNQHAGGEEADAHPERRRKAAYKAYEEREIEILRKEHPGLKLSQIKEIIFKNVS